jgi:kinesin family member 5
MIAQGQRNRITCATKMNEHSSRSHLILQLTLSQTALPDGPSKTSRLFLIDLAGSEKISKTGAEGKVLEEAKKINLSLTNLGNVIKALSERKGQGHVPYRNSKLTKILRESLGGNSKTTLIVTCSPHEMHLSETISTLRFGENAQKVKNKPKINRELTVQELVKLKEKLEADLADRDGRIKCLEEYITVTLKAELPTFRMSKPEEEHEEEEKEVIEKESELQQSNDTSSPSLVRSKEGESAARVREVEEQLRASS